MLNFSIIVDPDMLFHLRDPTNQKFQATNIYQLFRSDYSKYNEANFKEVTKLNVRPPPITIYTGINLGAAFGLFGVLYIVYGLLITLIKYAMNDDFKSSSCGKRCQHILETLNSPEAFR